ncbi:hypothetical protein E2320_009844 [Naja naja]|nr:hypothetical protein E2320_009844 [Naja naja]
MASYIIPLVKADTFLYRLSSTDIRRQISKRVVTNRFPPIYLSLGNEQARVTFKQHLFDIDCQTDTCNTTQLPTGDPRITYLYQVCILHSLTSQIRQELLLSPITSKPSNYPISDLQNKIQSSTSNFYFLTFILK